MDLSEKEKAFWRVVAAMQEIFRVTDDDVDKNSDLKMLLYEVANVAVLYREHGADSILQDRRMRELKKLGIPTIGRDPKKK